MQHKLLAVAAVVSGLVLTVSSEALAQVRRAPVPTTSATPTGSSGVPARDAAYGDTAGQGRAETPSTADTQSSGFGRPNPGRPEFEDPDYRGGEGATGVPPLESPNNRGNEGQRAQGAQANDAEAAGSRATGGEGGQNAEGSNNQDASGQDANVLQVADGFFFDNYTSGSGFGVYGGEAVTSGSGEQSNPRQDLPSAGVIFRNLGIQP